MTLLGGGVFLDYATWYGIMAFYEMRERGYWIHAGSWRTTSDRIHFLWFLKITLPLLYLVGILSLAEACCCVDHVGA